MKQLFRVVALFLGMFVSQAFAQSNGTFNVIAFGADAKGVADSATAIQATINAAPAGSTVLIPAGGTFKLSTTMTVNKALTIYIDGTLSPFSNPGSAIPMVNITASNVTVDCQGTGTIDGLTSSYQNFLQGIAVTNPTNATLSNETIKNCTIQNIALTNASAQAIRIASTINPVVTGNTINNIGYSSTTPAGGVGIYTQYAVHGDISGNRISYSGTCINVSGGVNNVVARNRCDHMVNFGMKAGYGVGPQVTADIAASTTQVSIAASTNPLAFVFEGEAMTFLSASAPSPFGIVQSITNAGHSSYYVITFAQPLSAAPATGDYVEPNDTGTLWTANQLLWTGGNAHDFNGSYAPTISDTHTNFAGMWQPNGSTYVAAVGSYAVWIGYDPQSGYQNFGPYGAKVIGNTFDNSGTSAVDLNATHINLLVSGNTITDWGLRDSPKTDTSAAIALNLNYFRPVYDTIAGNTMNSANGVCVIMSYAKNSSISHNTCVAPYGIQVSSANNVMITYNNVTATYANAASYGIKNLDVSVNPTDTLLIDGNYVNMAGGNGIWQEDGTGNAANVNITGTNSVLGAPAANFVNAADTTVPTNPPVQVPLNGSGVVTSGSLSFVVANNGVATLGKWAADSGTEGHFKFQGSAWDEVSFHGSTFTSIGYGSQTAATTSTTILPAAGTAAVVTTDFTASCSSGICSLTYTNNSGNIIHMSGVGTSNPR